ncbi:MAG: hypothetical protein IPM54_30870 [Polyangiaceae bacterium]|nr:hypothetical protein [Polyangiaceae bacterium]
MARAFVLLSCLVCITSCSATPERHAHQTRPIAPAAPMPSASAQPAPIAPPVATEPPAAPPAPPTHPGRPEAAERVLFLATHLRTDGLREACPVALAEVIRIRCLISLRFADEPDARKLALTLYEETGSLAGLLPEESTVDGKGKKILLKPARPIGRNKEHLTWIIGAMREYARFFTELSKRQKMPIVMRDRPLDFRFFYTEDGGTPSAFAVSQNIGYNLYGAVNVNDEAVRDTLFHEIFHLNDAWQDNFSARVLAPIEARIIASCKGSEKCLEPYAPTDTTMNGKSYAFIDGGSGKEYAAELALRYFREQRLMIDGKPLPVPAFKCGPAENAEAMALLVDAFFGGVDLVPPCET